MKTNNTNTDDKISVAAAFAFKEKVGNTDVNVSDLNIDYARADGKSTATLDSSNTSCKFTLNLTGKPAKAFNGTIGTVTLTFKEVVFVKIMNRKERSRYEKENHTSSGGCTLPCVRDRDGRCPLHSQNGNGRVYPARL